MPVSQRERTVAAPREAVWEILEDPHHMPRWWPGVVRMEAVDAERFTQVFMTKRGKPVRADFHVLASDAPIRRAWEQEVAGTPFGRVLAEAVTEVVLEPVEGGTRVTLAVRQKLRGYSRTGGLFVSRATSERLEEALEGLAGLLG